MVCPTVMAFRKNGDGVYVTDLQRFLKIFFGKFAANFINTFTCMEIKVNLSESHIRFSFE
jgi:hypothetical protein